MLILVSAWVSNLTWFYLAALACGVLSRRGFLPLHIPAAIGLSAYVFTWSAHRTGLAFVAPAVLGVVAASVFGAATSLLFLRLRGAGAALASISLQLIFEQYAENVGWTGGSAGLWQGIPQLDGSAKLAICFLAGLVCSAVYAWYQRTALAAIITADGTKPALCAAVSASSPWVKLLAAGAISGFLAGCAGLVATIQLGFISSSNFSISLGLLYVGIILLVGHERLATIGVGALIIATLPAVLRAAGLGRVEVSAWRGVIVGAVVLAVVLLQAPRASAPASELEVLSK